MSSIKLKYTKVEIEAQPSDKDGYCGYLAVQFNYNDDRSKFFMDAYDNRVLGRISYFMKQKGYDSKDVTLEDTSILINLSSEADKVYAPDLVKIVKEIETEFDEKVG